MVLAPVLAQKSERGSRQLARARRTQTNAPSDEPPLLRVSHEQITAELDDRIEKGREILEDAQVIGSEDAHQACRSEYRRWTDYNTELLTRRFTTSKIADDYNWWGVGSIALGGRPFSEKVRELVGDVGTKIERLESLRGRVELIDTAKGPDWQGTAAAAVREAPVPQRSAPTRERRVFIVHGHDTAAKLEVHRFVANATDHEAVILHEQPNRGATVIEKFEREGGPAAFAVVLLTADDEGRAKTADALNPRGRQNVVFEFGYFAGKIGRERTAVLYEPGVELPSDLGGLVYIELDPRGAWRQDLAREFRAAGVVVDLNKI
jgi:predicted nucleotide-binding protein